MGAQLPDLLNAAPVLLYTIICFTFLFGLSNYLVMKDQLKVCPLSCEMLLQPLSTQLTGSIRFLQPPLPTILSATLTGYFPLREDYGLTVFCFRT